ncbi:tryptophan-rich sensory protein [Flavobacteriaceae bacterium]|nr:tryptophan-rich sensory protein [Flavobacteriaceae bacterium]
MIRFLIFLGLNFGALALGSLFTKAGVSSDWYQELNKAPWTPPGAVFGVAWTTIMICFTIYMSRLWRAMLYKQEVIILFALQWILNVSWNPLFFGIQTPIIALVTIVLLTALVFYIMNKYKEKVFSYSLLMLPYFIWLVIATSLNTYVVLFN